jgi:NAD-dependent deacetylase
MTSGSCDSTQQLLYPCTGVSAESGIATFRDAGGLWCKYRVEEVASPDACSHDARLVWKFYFIRRRDALAAKPNKAHFALAKWEHDLHGRLLICTQNIDDLHQQAGSRAVVHMHGELFKSRCDTCSRPPFADSNIYDPPSQIPRCECGGRIRPHICWFGEVPFELDRIFRALDECTLFMAVGTSGMVEPAASFVEHVRVRARTVYVGPGRTCERIVVCRMPSGESRRVLPQMLAVEGR